MKRGERSRDARRMRQEEKKRDAVGRGEGGGYESEVRLNEKKESSSDAAGARRLESSSTRASKKPIESVQQWLCGAARVSCLLFHPPAILLSRE